MALLPCVEINPKGGDADATVILLHGLGADGHDFEPIVPELNLPDSARVRFIFPHAPSRPVTINGGASMPSWYDIRAIDIDRSVDNEQLSRSAEDARAFVQRERERGVAGERIILAGFSQGGAVVLHTALTHPERLGGLLVLSSYFATADTIQPHKANADLPILVCHGTADPMVPELLGQRTVHTLKARGYPVEYRSYPMPHAVHPDEIRHIGQWLRQRLDR
ncbi:MAG: alpha/beta fold hydrolase [Oleiphilaceae bacterium]|nr:alpha/beta fold hydrolase [Oleiphilaceae bacterium]